MKIFAKANIIFGANGGSVHKQVILFVELELVFLENQSKCFLLDTVHTLFMLLVCVLFMYTSKLVTPI